MLKKPWPGIELRINEVNMGHDTPLSSLGSFHVTNGSFFGTEIAFLLIRRCSSISSFPDSTRRGDVEAGTQQSNSRCTSFYTF